MLLNTLSPHIVGTDKYFIFYKSQKKITIPPIAKFYVVGKKMEHKCRSCLQTWAIIFQQGEKEKVTIVLPVRSKYHKKMVKGKNHTRTTSMLILHLKIKLSGSIFDSFFSLGDIGCIILNTLILLYVQYIFHFDGPALNYLQMTHNILHRPHTQIPRSQKLGSPRVHGHGFVAHFLLNYQFLHEFLDP